MDIRRLTIQNLQHLSSGEQLQNWELVNDNGMLVTLNNYGPTLTQLLIPDKNNSFQNIVLHYDNVGKYEQDTTMGRIAIGQYADLITNATYKLLDGTTVKLHPNNGIHMLHGGIHGWAMQVWKVGKTECSKDKASIEFHLHDPEMGIDRKGLPGNIDASVKVTLTNNNKLHFEYSATTDKTVPIKITNHSYFNLNGTTPTTTIHNHILKTNADRYVDINKDGLPTGEINHIDQSCTSPDQDLDHCLLFPQNITGEVDLYSPETGIRMTVRTDQPAVQLYNGVNLQKPFIKHGALCIEPQQPIDYINHPEWHKLFNKPFTEKDDIYSQKSSYVFSIEK